MEAEADDFTGLIGAAELHRRLGAPGWTIVDCRFELARPNAGREAYLAGHIPGAVYAHLDEDLAGTITPGSGRHPLPTPEAFAATLGRLGIGNDSQVACYDDASGAIAARLWWMLRWLGHVRVAVLDGGMKAWLEAGFSVENGAVTPVARTFRPREKAGAWLTTDEVERKMSEDSIALVDARAADRFAGQNETIDPVAGHVPGARNHPFARNLEPGGRFLPGEELRRRWVQTLGNAQKPVVCMCGSGVTACHDLLALQVAGLPAGQLYAGSWSEWIRDPRRPVATRL